MAGYWPSSFFACLWTETESRSINIFGVLTIFGVWRANQRAPSTLFTVLVYTNKGYYMAEWTSQVSAFLLFKIFTIHNICSNLSKISNHFPKIYKDFPKFVRRPDKRFWKRRPKKIRRRLDHTPTNLSVVKGTKNVIKNDIFTREDFISFLSVFKMFSCF